MAFGDAQVKFARDAADQTHEAVNSFLVDKIGKGATATIIASVAAALVMVVAVVLTVALGIIFTIGSQVAAIFLETLGEVRNDNQGALNPVMAAALGDLLGVEIGADSIPQGGQGADNIPRMRAIGGLLHDLLKREFGGDGTPDSVDGAAAARAFTGFNINFSAGTAIISILGEMSSLGYFKEFREVGESVAENLGLGRLHRGALKPLVDTLVSKPYTRQLLAQYRQTRLSPEQYVHGFGAGKVDGSALQTHLSEAGYTDADISLLQDLLPSRPEVSALAQLERAGRITRDAAINILTLQGYIPAEADALMLAQQLTRDASLQGAYIQEAYNLARDRHITEADFQGVLDSITMPESEKQLWSQRLSLHLLHPTKRISILQLAYLGERNQITDAEVDAWITAEGYDETDAQLIHLYVLGKELDYDATQRKKSASGLAAKARRLKALAAAADKAVAAASKALAGATPDTLAQLEAALQAAELKAQQAHAAYDAAQAAADAAANQGA
jgi:hypothetical protein